DHEGLGGAVGQRGQGAVDALPAGGGAGLAGRRVGDGGDVQAGVNRVGDVHRGGVAGPGVGDLDGEGVTGGAAIHLPVLGDLLDGDGHVAGDGHRVGAGGVGGLSGGGGGGGVGDRRVGCHRGGHRVGDHEGLGGAVGQ